jgi:uncharacterized membrane protein HdeD (DUF308 family)
MANVWRTAQVRERIRVRRMQARERMQELMGRRLPLQWWIVIVAGAFAVTGGIYFLFNT